MTTTASDSLHEQVKRVAYALWEQAGHPSEAQERMYFAALNLFQSRVITLQQILRGESSVLLVYHGAAGRWTFLQRDTYLDDDSVEVPLSELVALDQSLVDVLDLHEGWNATRDGRGWPWRRWADDDINKGGQLRREWREWVLSTIADDHERVRCALDSVEDLIDEAGRLCEGTDSDDRYRAALLLLKEAETLLHRTCASEKRRYPIIGWTRAGAASAHRFDFLHDAICQRAKLIEESAPPVVLANLRGSLPDGSWSANLW